MQDAKNRLVYMVTNEPTLPTHRDARKSMETKIPNLILGHEASWIGHRLLADHSAPTHLQMAACAQAEHVCDDEGERGRGEGEREEGERGRLATVSLPIIPLPPTSRWLLALKLNMYVDMRERRGTGERAEGE